MAARLTLLLSPVLNAALGPSNTNTSLEPPESSPPHSDPERPAVGPVRCQTNPASCVGVPGLSDVCAPLPPAETCSLEICSLKPHTTVRLEARTYYQNASIQLPEGVRLIGAGINKTIIVACGLPNAGRGFILGNNSYLGVSTQHIRQFACELYTFVDRLLATAVAWQHFTWQGLQPHRSNFDAAIGTPGCLQPHNDGYPKKLGLCTGGCIPAGGDCVGVQNATAEHIHVRPYAHGDDWWPLSTSAGWFPHTMPWGPQRHTGSQNITLRGIISWGTWADGRPMPPQLVLFRIDNVVENTHRICTIPPVAGINFHGEHHNVLIEDCEMGFTSDDPYGLWSVSPQATCYLPGSSLTG